MSHQSSDGVSTKKEGNSYLEENVISCRDLKNALENEKNVEMFSNPANVKLEIKEEYWWENETAEPKKSLPETHFEFIASLKVNKQDISVKSVNDDLSLLEPARFTTEEVNDGKAISTSPIHSRQASELDFKTPGVNHKIINMETPERQSHCEVNHNPGDECILPLKSFKISNKKNHLHKCEFCEKSFKHKSSLEGHVLCHSDTKPYNCNLCEKSFKRKSELNRHNFIHSGAKPFECDICKKSFSTKQVIAQHIISHSDSKPHKCDSCEKRFNRKSALDRHAFCHTGKRPFKCESCETTFYQKSDLNKHTLWHSGEKPYKCDICGKTFSNKSNLTKHIFCHLGSKPYRCEICGRKFNRKSTLTRHGFCHFRLKPI